MSQINIDMNFDHETPAKIQIFDQWNIRKIHHSDNDPLVALDCRGPFNGAATVLLDLNKNEFRSPFPEPFARNPVRDLAENVAKAIAFKP